MSDSWSAAIGQTVTVTLAWLALASIVNATATMLQPQFLQNKHTIRHSSVAKLEFTTTVFGLTAKQANVMDRASGEELSHRDDEQLG